MNHLAELYLEATALSGLPASVENLSGVTAIYLCYCKHLESLPRSIFRLKCLKKLDVSGCSNLKNLPDDLGILVGLQELHCSHTAIQTIPSSISLLKNLKHLSLRGCNALGSQVSSLNHGQKSVGGHFHNLSGLCSLTMLDLSDCNISDGGTLCNLGFLPSLEELYLDGNNFSNIPNASISRLTRLQFLALSGCTRLQSFPKLPPSIRRLYADECTSLKSIDQLTKYPMPQMVSLTKCHQLPRNKCHASMLDSLLTHMLKTSLSLCKHTLGICISGLEIPEWFTYKNWGTSISVDLPKNWRTLTFVGCAVCVVFYSTAPASRICPIYPKNFQHLGLKFRWIRRDRSRNELTSYFGFLIGSEKSLDLGNIFLGYWPFCAVPV